MLSKIVLTLLGGIGLLLSSCNQMSSTQTASVPTHPAVLEANFVFEEAPFPECHASTIEETPAGMAIAWFGGTHEKHEDVEIWLSHQNEGGWTTPQSVAHGIQPDGKRFPCWNPVLYQYPDGLLYLFYKVGPNPREWWGEWKTSADNGKSWSAAMRIPDGSLGPVRNKPLLLPDGTLLCGSSTEADSIGWRVFMDHFNPELGLWTHTPMLHGEAFDAIQPTLLQHKNGEIQALCRTKQSKVLSFSSTDQGKSWTAGELLEIPNNNSGIDGVSLQDGRFLLVYNHVDTPKGKWGGERSPLNIGLSDDGKSWKNILELENEPGGEFSYPAVIQAKDGSIQVVYTWKRQRIRYVVLEPAKLI